MTILRNVNIRGFRSSDSTWQNLRLDKATNSIQTVDYEHHEIHAGSHFIVADVVDLAINEVYDLQLTTPNTTKWSHLTFEVDAESETAWYIYEGATISTAGTGITPINNNRNSATTSGNTLAGILNTSLVNANADTAVAGATLLERGIIGTGKGSGGSDARNRELILKQNTIYCFRAVANAAGYIDFVMSWYEHTDIA